MSSMEKLYRSVCENGILVLSSEPDFNSDYETYCEARDSLSGKVRSRFEKTAEMFANCEDIKRIKMVNYNFEMFASDPEVNKLFNLLIKREERLCFHGCGPIARLLVRVFQPKW